MDKRTILAIVLSSAILIFYYGFWYKPPAPAPQPPGPSATVAPVPTTAPGPAAAVPTAPPIETPHRGVATVKAPLVLSAAETKWVRAELSSLSGLPVHWWLKEFFQKADRKGPNTDLLRGAPPAWPMALLMFPGQNILEPGFSIQSATAEQVSYLAQVGGLELQQTLAFTAGDYAMDVTLRVKNIGESPQNLAPGLRLAIPQAPKRPKKFLDFQPQGDLVHPLYMMGNSVTREQEVEKLGSYQEKVGDVSWAGVEDQYFLRVVIARSLSANNKAAYGVKGDGVFADFSYAAEILPVGAEKEYQFTVYLGPKDPTYLNQFASVQLGKAIDFGWFAVVAQPILWSMKFFNRFLHNWGLSIILLTVIIKILLQPLTKKSMQSMKAMQELQPQLKALREKFGEDRERLNMETMSLFKRHKVNPMGGCLPMLLQMPIYIALYKVLYNATELYHAPFFWFYRDLSAPDPFFIMPVLLGVFMVLQQKLTPTASADPAQAKMMMIMPVVFSAFMLFLPVGLVLYIFVNTVMTVVQQWMHQKNISIWGMLKARKP